jgi:REP element-mobilizing transposase RayT
MEYNAANLEHYVLHAFVVMPNRVHLLATPALALPKLTKSLKGITSKRANTILAMTGSCFWQEESYDHPVRKEREFAEIQSYIEENPVRAGLVREESEYRWSSGGWATRRSPADQGIGIKIDAPLPASPIGPPGIISARRSLVPEGSFRGRLRGGQIATWGSWSSLLRVARLSAKLT